MYIAPGQGRKRLEDKLLTSDGDKMLMSTESPYHFAHLLQVLKQSLWIMILNTFLMILYMYIDPGQGQTTHWGQTFDVNRKPLSLCLLVACLKKIALKSNFIYIFFMIHVYSPGQGQTIHWGQNFDDNRRAFSLCPYVASFKMTSLKSDFIHIFNDFIHVYSPGARAENALRINFWGQQKAIITSTTGCKFQMNLFEFWFYTHIF